MSTTNPKPVEPRYCLPHPGPDAFLPIGPASEITGEKVPLLVKAGTSFDYADVPNLTWLPLNEPAVAAMRAAIAKKVEIFRDNLSTTDPRSKAAATLRGRIASFEQRFRDLKVLPEPLPPPKRTDGIEMVTMSNMSGLGGRPGTR